MFNAFSFDGITNVIHIIKFYNFYTTTQHVSFNNFKMFDNCYLLNKCRTLEWTFPSNIGEHTFELPPFYVTTDSRFLIERQGTMLLRNKHMLILDTELFLIHGLI